MKYLQTTFFSFLRMVEVSRVSNFVLRLSIDDFPDKRGWVGKHR